jgi:hypothetical protein
MPDTGGSEICPRYPRWRISVRTPSFQAPKSVRPERIGICVTVGKVLAGAGVKEVEERETEGVSKGG